jgi:hypothetical protein
MQKRQRIIFVIMEIGINEHNCKTTFGRNGWLTRPGERDKDGAPFEVLPTRCPKYSGPPSGRRWRSTDIAGRWTTLMHCHPNPCFLAGWLLMAGISTYYDFTWASVLVEP